MGFFDYAQNDRGRYKKNIYTNTAFSKFFPFTIEISRANKYYISIKFCSFMGQKG